MTDAELENAIRKMGWELSEIEGMWVHGDTRCTLHAAHSLELAAWHNHRGDCMRNNNMAPDERERRRREYIR